MGARSSSPRSSAGGAPASPKGRRVSIVGSAPPPAKTGAEHEAEWRGLLAALVEAMAGLSEADHVMTRGHRGIELEAAIHQFQRDWTIEQRTIPYAVRANANKMGKIRAEMARNVGLAAECDELWVFVGSWDTSDHGTRHVLLSGKRLRTKLVDFAKKLGRQDQR